MICPLLQTGQELQKAKGYGSRLASCLENKCAWWLEDRQRENAMCSIKWIAKEAVRRNLPK